jgi:hypothetical protein
MSELGKLDGKDKLIQSRKIIVYYYERLNVPVCHVDTLILYLPAESARVGRPSLFPPSSASTPPCNRLLVRKLPFLM